MTNYFILEAQESDEYCAIYDFPDNMEDIEMPSDGSRMNGLYEPQTFRMADEVPGLVIPDVINNALGYLMVSPPVQALLSSRATAEIEYLPFTILNHKGRPSGNGYIVNVIGTVSCVDIEKTEGLPDPVNEGWLMSLDVLHLDQEQADRAPNIFRIDVMPRVIVIRDDLRAALQDHGVTGARYLKTGEEIDL